MKLAQANKCVYQPDKHLGKLSAKKQQKLYETLSLITIVDPSCGTGSFLIGMANMISELFTDL